MQIVIHKVIKYLFICLLFVAPASLFGQEQTKEEMDREKQFRESLDKMVENYENDLKLEPWQVFYVDSILTHDFTALSEEVKMMSKARVENPDLYQAARDKWMEQIYNAFHQVLDEKQWARYLKNGAAKDKKNRDKRAENKNKK